jgi:hypothetical protein
MKMPKNWNKLSSSEQESWLVVKLQEHYAIENQISKMLAKLRGGQRIHIADEITRPDEALLKS